MLPVAPSFSSRRLISIVPVLFSLVLVSLVGCGGGGDGAPAEPAANPTGYYEGTASVFEADNSTPLELTDLKALVHNGRMLIMSASNVLLYEVGGLSISGDDFSATVTIYRDGVFLATTTATGTITEGASISGNLAGSGEGNGSFTVDYNAINSNDAELATVATSWQGSLNGAFSLTSFELNSSGEMITTVASIVTNLAECFISGTFTPVANENLYSISAMTLSDCDDATVNGTDYSGLATTKELGGLSIPVPDGLMIIAFSNGEYSGTGEVPLD